MLTSSFRWIVVPLVWITIFLIFLLTAIPYYSGDVKNHLVWAESILNLGTYGFYQRDFHDFAFPNYPPLSMLSFALSLKLYQAVSWLVVFLNSWAEFFPSNLVFFFQSENVKMAFLKIPALLSNLGIAAAIYYMANKFVIKIPKQSKILYSFLFLINPAFIYLSIIWGQIDLLPILFLLMSFYLLFERKLLLSSFFITLALLSKQTVLIFWFIFLYLAFRNFGMKGAAKSFLITIVLFYISYVPFNESSLMWPFELYKMNFSLVAESVGENALNIWGFLYDFKSASDTQFLSVLTLQQVGYLLFIAASLVPTIFFMKREINLQSIFLYLLIISLTYFFFLTRMHERYLAPAVVFSSLLAICNKKFLGILIFFSFYYLLNLYRGLYQPDIAIFNSLVNSILVLKILVIIYLFILVYLNTIIKENNET